MTFTSRKAALAGLATIGVSALVLTGCSAAPSDNGPSKSASNFLPCMVSDLGGFNDHSFNELGLNGLQAAAKGLGVNEKHVESKTADDYAPNIDSLLSEGCNLIVGAGFLLSADMLKAAKANPDVKFANIDDGLDAAGGPPDAKGNPTPDGKPDYPNGKGILFNTQEAAFLGGYAAAAYSKTGVVGTFGGIQIPPVTVFMDGFVDGVAYYNQQNGKNVKAIGWDKAKQTGVFTGGFDAGADAKKAAQGLLDQNADVILPVGGPIYQSAGDAIHEKNRKGGSVTLIGVDADVFNTDPKVQDILLTSVMKGVDAGVKAVVEATASGDFSNAPFIGTLKNGALGLAPFHNFESKVPADLQSKLDAIKAKIISGEIPVTSQAAPK